MSNIFDFFDIAIYRTNDPEFKSMDGKEVVIRGKVETSDGKWEYGVSLLSLLGEGEIVRAIQDELEHTGKKTTQDALFSEETVKIFVDPKTGKGTIVEEDD